MKKILFVVSLLMFISFGHSQNKLNEYVTSLEGVIEEQEVKVNTDGSIQIQEIFEFGEDYTFNKLYNLAKSYIINGYNSPNHVIQLDDKENGRIIVKGNYETLTCDCSDVVLLGSAMEYTPKHTLQIDCKEGRMRITIKVWSITQKSGAVGNAYAPSLEYIDFFPSDFFPYSTQGKVFYSRSFANNFTGKQLLKAEYHEASVILQVILLMESQIKSIESSIEKSKSDDSMNDDW